MKYTDKKGSVIIKLKAQEDVFIISVEDNGIGIPKKDMSKIFDRFYQSDNHINKSGGSGIGLAFSKEIIERHNGHIEVDSTVNKGSTFTITLPKLIAINPDINIASSKNINTNNTSSYKYSQIEKTPTILIVDDSYDMRVYLKDILSNYKCLEAENGIVAMDIVNTHPIDFIVTDYMMPKMDGLKLIEHLKLDHADIPILMLTARTDNQIKLSSLRLGIDDYLTKPFEEEELVIRIKNALTNSNKRKQYNQEENITPNTDNNWIRSIQVYIEKTSGKHPLTQTHIAKYFNMSLSSLYRKIKSETGLSPRAFITEVKLQKARHLIENKQVHSLKHLTLEVGFKHSYNFSNMYYKRFGNKPNIK